MDSLKVNLTWLPELNQYVLTGQTQMSWAAMHNRGEKTGVEMFCSLLISMHDVLRRTVLLLLLLSPVHHFIYC